MILMVLALQAAQPAPSSPPPLLRPDIQLHLNATARRVVVERKGEVELELRTAANGRQGENNVVEVNAPDLPQGRTRLDNVRVEVRAEARIPDPQIDRPQQEPATPR